MKKVVLSTLIALCASFSYAQSCVTETKAEFRALCQQAGGTFAEYEDYWDTSNVLFHWIKWGSGQKPGSDECGYIRDGRPWDPEYSHALVCHGKTPPPPPPPCVGCECDNSCPPPPPPPPPPCEECDEVISLSLTDDCLGTDELLVFNHYGGSTFDVYVCVDGEPFEVLTFEVPYFGEGYWHRRYDIVTGYCPTRAVVWLNPVPPQECAPWFTNPTALDMFVLP